MIHTINAYFVHLFSSHPIKQVINAMMNISFNFSHAPS
nr:MAG TPA: hypothetical protein [Caudoviricetes sp.]DAO75221.1 MAG TPA: hypothetical protein [Bacteriophage sp.]